MSECYELCIDDYDDITTDDERNEIYHFFLDGMCDELAKYGSNECVYEDGDYDNVFLLIIPNGIFERIKLTTGVDFIRENSLFDTMVARGWGGQHNEITVWYDVTWTKL